MKCPHCERKTDVADGKCEWCAGDLTFVSEDDQDTQEVTTNENPPFEQNNNLQDSNMIDDFVIEDGEPTPIRAQDDSSLPDAISPEGIAIGIDLGTTNSVVGIYMDGKAKCIDVEGNYLVPSVISFKDERTMLVGKQAKRRAEIDPENTVRSIKRKMGDPDYAISIYGQRLTPPQISSFILRKLKDAASKYVGAGIANAVVTVPAYFTSNQKEDTRRAAELAGLRVLRLLPEPSAAAIAYGLEKQRDQAIMVYDLGGGTFDVSILQVQGTQFEVKAISGNHDLGGDDFDRHISDFLIGEFGKVEKIDLVGDRGISREDKRRAFQILMETSEKAKKELSEAEVAYVDVPDLVPGHHLSVEIARDQFDDMIRPKVESTRDQIMEALKEADMTKHDIDRVVLVGGSTIIPMVKEFVASEVKEPYIADNVLQTVAEGASILASSLANAELPEEIKDEKRRVGGIWEAPPPIELNEKTAHPLGILLTDTRTGQEYFSCMIEKGEKLPAEFSQITTTTCDNQPKIIYPIFQGEKMRNIDWLGELTIGNIRRARQGVPQVEVTLRMDENDILEASALDLETGNKSDISIDKKKKPDLTRRTL